MSQEAASVRIDLEGPLFHRVENWRRAQGKIPPRADAVRQLIQQALEQQPDEAAAS
jgi:hypothetical protein